MMSRIDSRHWKISTGRHFQNGRHNTAQIQQCPISPTFHMKVDYDVPNWFLAPAQQNLKIYLSLRIFSNKDLSQSNLSISLFENILRLKYILKFCGAGAWHRKISTGRHFQNGRHNTAQIQHCSISTKIHM